MKDFSISTQLPFIWFYYTRVFLFIIESRIQLNFFLSHWLSLLCSKYLWPDAIDFSFCSHLWSSGLSVVTRFLKVSCITYPWSLCGGKSCKSHSSTMKFTATSSQVTYFISASQFSCFLHNCFWGQLSQSDRNWVTWILSQLESRSCPFRLLFSSFQILPSSFSCCRGSH